MTSPDYVLAFADSVNPFMFIDPAGAKVDRVDIAPVLVGCPLWQVRAVHLHSLGVEKMYPPRKGQLLPSPAGDFADDHDVVATASTLRDLVLASPQGKRLERPAHRWSVLFAGLEQWITAHRPAYHLEVLLAEIVAGKPGLTSTLETSLCNWADRTREAKPGQLRVRTEEQADALRLVLAQVSWAISHALSVEQTAGKVEKVLDSLRAEGMSQDWVLAATNAGLSFSESRQAHHKGAAPSLEELRMLAAMRRGGRDLRSMPAL